MTITKSLKIFIATLLFFSIALIFFNIWRNSEESKDQKISQQAAEEKQSFSKEVVDELYKNTPEQFLITSPVDKNYLEAAPLDKENPISMVFFLSKNFKLKAIFDGKIKEILHEQKPLDNDEEKFEEILLESLSGEMTASYFFKGISLVKNGDLIEEGKILANINEENKINLYFFLKDKEGKFFKLSKAIFK
jgi:hypothetical protein